MRRFPAARSESTPVLLLFKIFSVLGSTHERHFENVIYTKLIKKQHIRFEQV